MNENDPEMSPAEEQFATWREDPAINYLVAQLVQHPEAAGLEALLRSAFEAGWDKGTDRALR